MSNQRQNKLIRHWLQRGWHDFLCTKWISIGFSSIFVLVGIIAYWILAKQGLGLIIYPFLSGFLVVAPILVTGFQRVARLLREGQTPKFTDLVLGIKEATPGIWFLTFILCFCYFIWITDAIVLYAMFFGIENVPLDAELLTNDTLREQVLSYLIFSGLMGLLIALIGFSVGAFSIPLILHQKKNLVGAVHTSVTTVFKNKILMIRWALTLATLLFITLIVILPLLVVVLPVTAYASYAAYVDLLENN